MKTLTIAALLALPACIARPCVDDLRSHRSYQILIDPSVSFGVTEHILNGASEWAQCGAGLVFAKVACADVTPAPGTICIVQESLAEIDKAYGNDSILDSTTVCFPAGPSGASIQLNPGADAQQVAHEMGHAMGLAHTGPGTVMCSNTGCAAQAVTEVDCANWRASRE